MYLLQLAGVLLASFLVSIAIRIVGGLTASGLLALFIVWAGGTYAIIHLERAAWGRHARR